MRYYLCSTLIALQLILLSCLTASTLAAEEKKPKDDRGKRNLDRQVAHPYAGPSPYRLERRISSGFHHPLYPPPPFYPGPPRPYTPYRKGRPHSYPVPPYAVQMEPLVHYSQRDPLYDTNIFSLNADPHNDLAGDDLLTENNHINENIHGNHHGYGPHKPHIIERPVYIKEPEPIIEIIIKESNVSLPATPPPPPPKKKKEQVQVFYVKYKKNPHGIGKDSVIYDKPIPALSPKLPEDEDEEEEQSPYIYQHETATLPPRPTTTLRTIIKPDSEVYHSPSGVKVTFGKEGFDYSKRASKAQDYNPSQPAPQFPQGRQLASFSNTYFKRPYTNQNVNSPPPGFRVPQPYRPFTFPPQSSPNYKPGARQSPPQLPPPPQTFSFVSPPFAKPVSQQYSSVPSSRHPPPPVPQFSHTISHPPPPNFQQQNPRPPTPQARQPVPYKPFDYLRPQQTVPQTPPNLPPQQPATHLNPNPQQAQIQFRPETHFSLHQQLPLPDQTHIFNPGLNQQEQLPQSRPIHQQEQLSRTRPIHQLEQLSQTRPIHQQEQLSQSRPTHQQIQLPQQPIERTHYQHQITHNQFNDEKHQVQQQNGISQNEHANNIQAAQSILPPGGQLIQSVPKYEQHISEVQPISQKENVQGLTSQELQQKLLQEFNFNSAVSERNQQQNSQEELLQQRQHIQAQLNQQRKQQEQLRNAQQYYHNNQQTNVQQHTTPRTVQQSTRRVEVYSTPKVTYHSTTAKPTTTQEPERPSTTTKDPKILEAQLPDEVPDDLREQLLSSGILNNADISVLDYDKVGDIPLSALPPDQLANFYGAGGGAQIAGSAPVPSLLKADGSEVEDRLTEGEVEEDDNNAEASEIQEVKAEYQPPVAMKVVKYDPETDKGQKVQESYVDEEAQQVDPVVLNDQSYNRYLPLKVNGSQFPIPDVPELKGKKISSVVVLAPVVYDFSTKREAREASQKSDDLDLIQGDALKQLLVDPNEENYKKFFQSENKTSSDKQAVILLVTDPLETGNKEKEIFMYDVATRTVSKLSGELSSAFVEAAEANSENNPEEVAAAESNVVETRVPFPENIDRSDVVLLDSDLEAAASDVTESKVPVIDPMQEEDLETQASEQLAGFIDMSQIRTSPNEDSIASGNRATANSNNVLISSGYSKTESA